MTPEQGHLAALLIIVIFAALMSASIRVIFYFLIKNKLQKHPIWKDIKNNPELEKFLGLFVRILNKSEANNSNQVMHKKDNGKGYTIWFGSDYFSFAVLEEEIGKFEAYFKIGKEHHDLIVTHLATMREFKGKMLTFEPKRKPIEEE